MTEEAKTDWKTLVLIRHAKSSWGNPMLPDFDRPLNERGLRDAPMMGERLATAHKLLPNLIISSTAKRAAQTARRIATAVGYDKDMIQWEEQLYHCEPATFRLVIGEIADSVKTVFIIAHNPGISEFASALAPSLQLSNLSTTGIVAVKAKVDDWAAFHYSLPTLVTYDYPKKERG